MTPTLLCSQQTSKCYQRKNFIVSMCRGKIASKFDLLRLIHNCINHISNLPTTLFRTPKLEAWKGAGSKITKLLTQICKIFWNFGSYVKSWDYLDFKYFLLQMISSKGNVNYCKNHKVLYLFSMNNYSVKAP